MESIEELEVIVREEWGSRDGDLKSPIGFKARADKG